jgi:23S rRNA (guanosine2251-2'-O)-methyltransferase
VAADYDRAAMKYRRPNPSGGLRRARPSGGHAAGPPRPPTAATGALPPKAAKRPWQRHGALERRKPPPLAAAAPDASARDASARDLVFGAEPVHELIAAAPGAVRTLYVRTDLQARFADDSERVRAAGGHVAAAEAAALARMAGGESRHQGVVALIREYSYAAFEDVTAAAPDPLLLVDGVTDPRNLGALLRSAEGAGLGTVVLARDRTAAVTPAAIKSSAGAWVHLKIARCGNVARAMEDLKEAGYWIAALSPGGDREIYDLDTTRRLALVVGSEGRGVREIVRKNADFVVRIPMYGKVGSLNVSVAAAVALFEIARRRAAAARAAASASGGEPP